MQVSAEQRWFWHDTCPSEIVSWFHESEVPAGGGPPGRTDRYFLQDGGSQLSIKERNIGAGEPARIEIKGLIARFPRNSVELWGKWPCASTPTGSSVCVHKTRWMRLYSLDGWGCEVRLDENETPIGNASRPSTGCQVELAKVTLEDHEGEWWTLGFEAFGDLSSAPLVLTRALDLLRPPLSDGEMLNYPQFLAANVNGQTRDLESAD